jgi:hypothetical protein
MTSNEKRRSRNAPDKLGTVLAGMQPDVEVSGLCRHEGLTLVLYYAWRKQLLGSASRVIK